MRYGETIQPAPLRNINFEKQRSDKQFELIAKSVFTLILIFASIKYLTSKSSWTIFDMANMFFHEVGHGLWRFTGQFWYVLGGTITEHLVNIGFGIYFLFKKAWYSVFFCIFWLGIGFVHSGVYISDARARLLPLTRGATIHDWNYLLTEMNLLTSDITIGNIVIFIGRVLILVAEILMILNIIKLLLKKIN